MEKANSHIKQFNSMILKNIVDLGQMASLLDLGKQFITMATCMKEIFKKVSAVAWVLIISIKFISTWEIGNKIHFGVKENFTEMIKFFFREILRKV